MPGVPTEPCETCGRALLAPAEPRAADQEARQRADEMNRARRAPPLSEWLEGATSVWVDAVYFADAGGEPEGMPVVRRTEREEYERQCAEDADTLKFAANYLDSVSAPIGIGAELRAIAVRIRENAG